MLPSGATLTSTHKMKSGIIKTLISQFLVYLLGAINPEQKAEVDALFAKQKEQKVADDANKAESATVEAKVVKGEQLIAKNDADIEAARKDLAVKLADIAKTESIEEVWKK